MCGFEGVVCASSFCPHPIRFLHVYSLQQIWFGISLIENFNYFDILNHLDIIVQAAGFVCMTNF
jgi:hypothetical protein